MLYILSDYSRKRKELHSKKNQQNVKVRSGHIDSDEGNYYLLDLLLESEKKLLDPVKCLIETQQIYSLDLRDAEMVSGTGGSTGINIAFELIKVHNLVSVFLHM